MPLGFVGINQMIDLLDYSHLKVIRPQCLNSWYRVTRNYQKYFVNPSQLFDTPKKTKSDNFSSQKRWNFSKAGLPVDFPVFLSAGLLDIMFAVLENFETLQRFQALNHQLHTLHCILKFSIAVDWFLWKVFFTALWFWYFFPFYHYFGNCYFYLKVCEAISLIAIQEVD